MNSHRASNSIQISVSDLMVTEAFYAGILELPLRRSLTAQGAPEHLIVDTGGIAIIFVEQQDVIRAHPVLEHRLTIFPRGIGLTLHFEVKDIEGISDAILEEDLEILYPLKRKPYGVKEMWCFDPDGYLVVLEESVDRKE